MPENEKPPAMRVDFYLFLYKLLDEGVNILAALAVDGVPVDVLRKMVSVLNVTAEKQYAKNGFCGKFPTRAVLIFTR